MLDAAINWVINHVPELPKLLNDVTGDTDAAKESAFAHDTIVMIIREVVEWVAGNILVDALTLGVAAAVEASATAAFLGAKVEQAEQAASRLVGICKALKDIVESLKALKGELETAKGLGRLKKFMSLGKDFESKALEVAKLRNFRIFGNGKAAKALDKIWDAGRQAKTRKKSKRSSRWARAAGDQAGMKAAMSGTVAATGLSPAPGLKGLAQNMGEGTLGNIADNGQGFAEITYLESPPVNRIAELLNAPPPVDREK